MKTLIKPIFIVVTITTSQNYLAQAAMTETKQDSKSEQVTTRVEQPETQARTQQSTTSNNNFAILGMNVRGNKESPMALNIVPWRSANHSYIAPEVTPGWQPKLTLLQPMAYRREINAFLKARTVQK